MKKETLEKIFNNVNYWLSFAEAKNALLAGFFVAAFGLIDHLIGEMPMWGINVLLILCLISLVIPIVSFFPLYKKSKTKPHGNNLLFYRDIAGFTVDEYITQLQEKYHCDDSSSEKGGDYSRDYIEEITTNSRITVYKMFMFKIGLALATVDIIFCCYMLIRY